MQQVEADNTMQQHHVEAAAANQIDADTARLPSAVSVASFLEDPEPEGEKLQ